MHFEVNDENDLDWISSRKVQKVILFLSFSLLICKLFSFLQHSVELLLFVQALPYLVRVAIDSFIAGGGGNYPSNYRIMDCFPLACIDD